MRIKQLKQGNQVRNNFEHKIEDAGATVWNVPKDLTDFKAIALDTINWQAGRNVLKVADTTVGLSTMNAKSQAVIVKLMSPTKAKLDSLTPDEKEAWRTMETLADNGYGNSKKLVDGLQAVIWAVAKATDKSMRVMQSNTHEAVISILNEG